MNEPHKTSPPFIGLLDSIFHMPLVFRISSEPEPNFSNNKLLAFSLNCSLRFDLSTIVIYLLIIKKIKN